MASLLHLLLRLLSLPFPVQTLQLHLLLPLSSLCRSHSSLCRPHSCLCCSIFCSHSWFCRCHSCLCRSTRCSHSCLCCSIIARSSANSDSLRSSSYEPKASKPSEPVVSGPLPDCDGSWPRDSDSRGLSDDKAILSTFPLDGRSGSRFWAGQAVSTPDE